MDSDLVRDAEKLVAVAAAVVDRVVGIAGYTAEAQFADWVDMEEPIQSFGVEEDQHVEVGEFEVVKAHEVLCFQVLDVVQCGLEMGLEVALLFVEMVSARDCSCHH